MSCARPRFGVRCALAALAALATTSLPRTTHAHEVRPSALDLSFQAQRLDATLHLPADQLGLALSSAWNDPSLLELGPARRDLDAARFERELARDLAVTDERGVGWRMEIESLEWTTEDSAAFLLAHVTFVAPDAHEPRALAVRDEVIGRQVVSHRTLVTITRDFGRAAAEPRVIGTLRFTGRSITVDRSDASAMRGARAMLELGARHIAEGLDHLLFLFVLLLAAPLVRSNDRTSRWAGARTPRATAVALAKIVTAFTLGHSLTLALGALGHASVPSAPVELLVALSIAVGAVHAVRPLFAEREPLVAGLFGLVHGLAFASTLEGFGLRGEALVLSLGAFHLGLELVQLGLVVAFAPLLAAAARAPSYTWLRTACACVAVLASAVWATERVTGSTTLASELLATAAAHPGLVGGVVWLGLLAWTLATTQARNPRSHAPHASAHRAQPLSDAQPVSHAQPLSDARPLSDAQA